MTSFDDALDNASDEIARAVAEEWREQAIETLRQVGGRVDYDVQPIIDSATPVTQTTDGYSFTFTHPASALFEFGSEPHTIEPDDPDGVLAFEADGETVFAKSVDHPGTDAILFVSKSQQRITERGIRQARLPE